MNSVTRILPVAILAGLTVVGVIWLSQNNPYSVPTTVTMEAPEKAENPPKGVVSGAVTPNLTRLDAYSLLNMPKVGATAPAFTVTDAEGQQVSLSDYVGQSHLALVFYQGYFCPVCGKQLEGMQAELDKIKAQGAQILAVSADDAEKAQKTAAERGLTFPVIPDPEKKLIDLFGVSNLAKEGIAWPAVIIIRQDGTVGYTYAHPKGIRMQAAELLTRLQALPEAAKAS